MAPQPRWPLDSLTVPVETLVARGEVSEREDLLDGRVRVSLEGEAGGWLIDAAFAWQRGREDVVRLDAEDSYITLLDGSRELHASVDEGTIDVDVETAEATVAATMTIEQSTGGPAAPGDPMACQITIGVDAWAGEVWLGQE